MEPITLIAISGIVTLIGAVILIVKRNRVDASVRAARVKRAKERAQQKAASKGFPDTEVLSDFEFGTKNKISDDKHLGYGMLTAQEDHIITAIFDDRLAPPLKVTPAYTVHGSYADSIFDERNISETIEPRFE